MADVTTTVHRITRAALAELDAGEVARTATQEVARAIGAQVGALFLGSASNVRREALVTNDIVGPLEAPSSLRLDPVTAGSGVRSADIMSDVGRGAAEEDLDWLEAAKPDWVPRSYLACPVFSRSGAVVGRFIFASREPGHFSDRDQEILEGVAGQVAVVLENALLLQQAQKAIRMRDEFLNIASHELKTPLTVLKGYALLLARRLRSGAVSTADVVGVAEELAAASERLDQLVNDLLDTSRIRTERLELRRSLIDVRRLVDSVVARFRQPNADTHEFVLDLEEGVVGYWDESRIDQVLTNLVSNAVRYSPDGGVVSVSVSRVDDNIYIEVRDQGIGIALDQQAQLFEPFKRLHADKRIVDGTGLGLYISQQIVARHDGSMSVESELNSGATFSVRLPMSLPTAVPES